jgi:protein-S-isoprenylcysteine O-methyltransferase Ste14
MKGIRHLASLYFAVQGVAVFLWWILLFAVPDTRAYFRMGDSDAILLAFWLPDLFLLAVGSLVAAVLIRSDSGLMQFVVWFVVGTIAYATLYCLAFAMMTDTGWLGVVLMFPAMIVSGNFAIGLSPALLEKLFRHAAESKTSWIYAKTIVQIVVVWGVILFVCPFLIIQIESKLGISRIEFPGQKAGASLLFLLNSSAGIWSALVMAKHGHGTPLPMDSARQLVTKGPYAFVRNPMAITGIGQGLSVAIFLGSPLVFLYALLGAFIWQVMIRPLEEADLQSRFGPDFDGYRQDVRCWIPRWQPVRKSGSGEN